MNWRSNAEACKRIQVTSHWKFVGLHGKITEDPVAPS